MKPEQILIADYTYDLPHERIAHFPLNERDASRLLVYGNGNLEDRHFRNLPEVLPPDSTLVFNDTRVIAARIFFQKVTGAHIELFCLEPWNAPVETALQQQGESRWKCLIGGASKWKPGQILEKDVLVGESGAQLRARYEGREGDSFIIHFSWEPAALSFYQLIGAAGAMPLPPYIKRQAEASDAERYQTVFSRQPGSVAAPTASLHFTPQLLKALKEKGVRSSYLTLHVGAGTFKPVKSPDIAGHVMHGEPFSVKRSFIQELLQAERIIPVGTTSLRTIESLHWLGARLCTGQDGGSWELSQWEAYELMKRGIAWKESGRALLDKMEREGWEELHCRTSLIIVPGYEFQLPAALITNFHQPGSTLLLLVAAFIGEDWRKVYGHALQHDYRFLSYGDSSLLWREAMIDGR